MLIGYARASATDQDLEMQLNELRLAGCEKIFTDKFCGTRSIHSGLNSALELVCEGDSLVVWRLGRLGRSIKGLADLAAALKIRKIELLSLTDGIDTTRKMGSFFNLIESLATMERELIREQENTVLLTVKHANTARGRKPALTQKKVETARQLLNAGQAPKVVAKVVGVSIATLYRHLPAKKRMYDDLQSPAFQTKHRV